MMASSMVLRIATMLGVVLLTQARPQNFYDAAQIGTSGGAAVLEGGAGLLETLHMGSGTASDVISGTLDTVTTLGDEFKDQAQNVWRRGSQTVRRFQGAVDDTAREASRGFSDTFDATQTYFADQFRTGGRLATGVAQTGFNVARDMVGASGDFLQAVRGSLRGGLENAVGAVDSFAEDFIDNRVRLIAAATGVAENVATRGIQSFSHVITPERF